MNAVSRNCRQAPVIAVNPRLAAMAEAMRELAHSPQGATEQALIGAGFSMAEILEYAVEAAALASISAQVDAARFDRVADILDKAVAAMPHRPPRVGGHDLDAEGLRRWSEFCTARAAFKLDPWTLQAERVLNKLDAALHRLPLIAQERNRVITGLAAAQKTAISPRGVS